MSGEFEKTIQTGISVSRWLLAPMYLGLALTLIVLLIQFVRDFFRTLPELFQLSALETLPLILTLGVILMVANIILMILQTGYELFASHTNNNAELSEGKGRIDFTTLRKRFLGAALVLSLLLIIREMISFTSGQTTPDSQSLLYLGALLGLLMITALLLAVADWFKMLSER